MATRLNLIIIILVMLFFEQVIYGEPMKKTIMIDLDGVLDDYSHYTEDIPNIRIGAKEFVETLSKNYELILFTTRSPKLSVEWLQNNKIDKYFKDVTNVKYPAYIYIDDRAIKFNGDYNKTLDEINNFDVHWKKPNKI